jgi:hypothetical protein
MLCLRPLTDIDALEPFSAVADGGKYGEGVLIEGHPMFNSGFFVFEPDRAFAEEIVSFFLSSEEPWKMGDQIVLNTFMWSRCPEKVHLVDPSWNTIKSRVGIDGDFTLDGVRLLHYVGRKPWEPIGPEPKHGHRYVPMYRLWWDYYERSPVAPLLDLTPPPFRMMTVLNAFPARRVWQAFAWSRGRLINT